MRAGSWADRRQRLGRALAVLLLFLTAACAAGTAPPPTTSGDVGRLAAALQDALTRGEEADFLAAFAADGPQALGRTLFSNLSGLLDVAIAAESEKLVVAWSDGCVASRQPLRVDWGDPAANRVRGLAAEGPEPLWLTSTIRLIRRGSVSVVAAGDASPWLAPAVGALEDLRGYPLGALTSGWSGCVSVQVPADALGLARLTGLPSAEAVATAAATYAEPAPAGADRVGVNPRLARTSAAERRAALIHEFVHVATGSTRRGGPVWVREGVAEAVTVALVPEARAARDRLVRDVTDPDAASLPTDADLSSGDPDDEQRRAYALASVAVEAVASRLGADEAARALAALMGQGSTDLSLDTITRWYRVRLQELAAR